MRFEKPKQQLREFLAAGPSWLLKIFQLDSLSTEELSDLYQSFWWWQHLSSGKAQNDFERLLRRCPDEWRKYRKFCKKVALSRLPSARPGRPRKDALADEARELKQAGLSQSEIADTLNRQYPNLKDRKGNDRPVTAEAVRKLLASRRREITPDKT